MDQQLVAIYRGAALNSTATNIIQVPLIDGTLTGVYIDLADVVDGPAVFNLAIEGVDQFTTELTIADGDSEIDVTGLSISTSKGTVAQLNLTTFPTTSLPAPPFSLILTIDDGVAAATGDVTLTGAQTLTNKKNSLTAAHATDDTYTGTQITGLNAGATIAQWEAVYLGGSSTWLLADANGSGTYPARGLATAAYVNTNAAAILVHGTVRNDAWSWTPGGTIYLSGTAGALTQTAPSTSGDKVQAVGYALTADIIFVDFNSTYLTLT